MSNEAKLKRAFCKGLDVDRDSLDWEGLQYRGIPEWDSLAHMEMVAEVEEAFDLAVEADDIMAMSSFPAAKQVLAKYGIDFE